jgi:hypothetical protein
MAHSECIHLLITTASLHYLAQEPFLLQHFLLGSNVICAVTIRATAQLHVECTIAELQLSTVDSEGYTVS